MEHKLLTRDEFRERVFLRDRHTCVFCTKPAEDAHHIIERRLWPDGGYYLENGASVCSEHHMLCEQTVISVEEVRERCAITKPIIPPHLYNDEVYDKWGNIVLPNGTRLKGELFFDESVQKVLASGNVLGLFTSVVKYPRTYHLPWSENITDDDRVLPSLAGFVGHRVVVTEKMDGENTTMYSDYIHARSVDGRNHPSRNWVKNFWSGIRHNIPEGWRICGENLYAKHSIGYDSLPSYFLGFSIWNDRNECLSWDESLEWFALMGITPVKVLFDGVFDESKLRSLKIDTNTSEGYVLRIADSFSYGKFKSHVGKYVRRNHVLTVKHWMYGQQIERNKLVTE